MTPEEYFKKEIIDILDNVSYWETCPEDYKARIKAIKQQLSTHNVINCGGGIPYNSLSDSFKKTIDSIEDNLDR